VRSVRGFAKQNKSRITDQLQQRIVIVRATRERLRDLANKLSVCHFDPIRFQLEGLLCAAWLNNSRTSSSLVCEKSS
jgi:hypothetical protein